MTKDELLKLAETVAAKKNCVEILGMKNTPFMASDDARYQVARDEMWDADRIYQKGLREYLSTPEGER